MTVPATLPSAEMMVRPTMPSTWDSASDVIMEFELLVHLDALLDVREARELGHELGRIHRLGRVLVLHLGDEQPQESVVVDGGGIGVGRRGGVLIERCVWVDCRYFHGLTSSSLLASPSPGAPLLTYARPSRMVLRDFDDALEVVRLLEPDLLGLAHDPQPDRNQIGPQLLRQIVLGLARSSIRMPTACARTAAPPPPRAIARRPCLPPAAARSIARWPGARAARAPCGVSSSTSA